VYDRKRAANEDVLLFTLDIFSPKAAQDEQEAAKVVDPRA
jgi:hypothetical protein